MRRTVQAPLFAAFAVTGFAALTLQVVWQRVISLHSGVDLVSFTTVVAAFLGGIGVGSLLGGVLADRLGPRASVLAFAASNVAIGVFSWASIWLFYDVYQQHAEALTTTAAKFGFNVVLLAVPTTLMGLSLPLVAKGIVGRAADAGALVGRLYAVNTGGAAVGAAATGWLLLGELGFAATVRLAGTLNLVAAVLVVAAYRLTADAVEEVGDASTAALPVIEGPVGADTSRAVWPWYVAYGLTGAVALGFETVLFRLIDTIVRSNSYSFGHVLSLYLALFGVGSAVGSRFVRRARRPGAWFLWIQFGVGLTALAGLIVLVRILPYGPTGNAVRTYFAREGFVTGFTTADGRLHPGLVPVLVGAPLLLMGLPVLGMGASFPFVQALVASRLASLGRHTGRLLFANVVGNVAGTLLVGFVAIDALGTAGTYRLLGLALLVPGLAAAVVTAHRAGWAADRRWARPAAVGATAVVMLAVVAAVPTNQRLYAGLHGVDPANLHLAEDRSCANALRVYPDGHEEMTVNASPQNDYPFDDFHLVLGLTPTLLQAEPREVMALGLGIGATPYGVTLDPRVRAVHAVEICGGEIPLLRDLGERRSPELRRFFADPRVDLRAGDGRDFLLRADRRFDVVVVDTLRPQAAFSGNLYSAEFYRLVRDRLTDGGMLAQWRPTGRTVNSALAVFPHVVEFETPNYHGSTFFVASKQPITVDREALAARAAAIGPDSGLDPERRAAVADFFRRLTPVCVYESGTGHRPAPEDTVNRDLRPRDEYFLNQSLDVPAQTPCQSKADVVAEAAGPAAATREPGSDR